MQLPPACAGAASSWAPSVPFCAAGPFPERRIATTLSRSPQHFGAGPSDHCAAQRTICSFCATLPSGSRAGPSDHCAAQRAIRPFCATLPSGSRLGGALCSRASPSDRHAAQRMRFPLLLLRSPPRGCPGGSFRSLHRTAHAFCCFVCPVLPSGCRLGGAEALRPYFCCTFSVGATCTRERILRA